MVHDSRRRLLQSVGAGAAFAALPGVPAAALQASEPSLARAGASPVDVRQFSASTAETPLDLINLIDIEAQAAKVIAPGAFSYIAGGAGDEWTMRENRAAFNRQLIVPRVLSGKSAPDLRTRILGTSITSPVIITPVAAA